MKEAVLRKALVDLLTAGHAHTTAKEALAGTTPRLRATAPPDGGHTVWELLEHMRIAQEDILRYTLDASWKSPTWPEGYWPASKKPSAAAWRASVAAFERDLRRAVALARDPKRDLTRLIPHGEGRTYLRQVLVIADHNSYHVGQIVQTRKALGDWT
jgi:uncharacterized damage-inducible protein DinB